MITIDSTLPIITSMLGGIFVALLVVFASLLDIGKQLKRIADKLEDTDDPTQDIPV